MAPVLTSSRSFWFSFWFWTWTWARTRRIWPDISSSRFFVLGSTSFPVRWRSWILSIWLINWWCSWWRWWRSSFLIYLWRSWCISRWSYARSTPISIIRIWRWIWITWIAAWTWTRNSFLFSLVRFIFLPSVEVRTGPSGPIRRNKINESFPDSNGSSNFYNRYSFTIHSTFCSRFIHCWCCTT